MDENLVNSCPFREDTVPLCTVRRIAIEFHRRAAPAGQLGGDRVGFQSIPPALITRADRRGRATNNFWSIRDPKSADEGEESDDTLKTYRKTV